MNQNYVICDDYALLSTFYVAVRNTITSASIDLANPKKVFFSQTKSLYSDEKSDSVTAMRQSILSGNAPNETLSYLAIAYK